MHFFLLRILLHISKLPSRIVFFYLRYHQRWMRLLAGPTFLSTRGIYIIFDLNMMLLLLLYIYQYPWHHSPVVFFFWFFFFVLSHLLGEKMQVVK